MALGMFIHTPKNIFIKIYSNRLSGRTKICHTFALQSKMTIGIKWEIDKRMNKKSLQNSHKAEKSAQQ